MGGLKLAQWKLFQSALSRSAFPMRSRPRNCGVPLTIRTRTRPPSRSCFSSAATIRSSMTATPCSATSVGTGGSKMGCINGSIAARWKTRAACATSTRLGTWACSAVWLSVWPSTGYSVSRTHGKPHFPVSLTPCANTRLAGHSPWLPPPRLPGCLSACIAQAGLDAQAPLRRRSPRLPRPPRHSCLRSLGGGSGAVAGRPQEPSPAGRTGHLGCRGVNKCRCPRNLTTFSPADSTGRSTKISHTRRK